MSERPPAGNNPETEVSHESGYEVSCKEFHELLEELLRRPYRSDGPLLTEDDRFVGLNDAGAEIYERFRDTCPETRCTRSDSCTRTFKAADHPRSTLLQWRDWRKTDARRERQATWVPKHRARAASRCKAEVPEDHRNLPLDAEGSDVPDGRGGVRLNHWPSGFDQAVLAELAGAILRYDFTQVRKDPEIVSASLTHAVEMIRVGSKTEDAAIDRFLVERYPDRYATHPEAGTRLNANKRQAKGRMLGVVRDTFVQICRDLGYP